MRMANFIPYIIPSNLLGKGFAVAVLRLKLGLAVGIGVLLGALPLIACHTIAIIYVTALLRLNKSLAIFSSQICAPPLMPALCIEAGHWLRNGRFLVLQDISSLSDSTFLELGHVGAKMILDWFTGSLVIGPFFALIVGLCGLFVVVFYSEKITLQKLKSNKNVNADKWDSRSFGCSWQHKFFYIMIRPCGPANGLYLHAYSCVMVYFCWSAAAREKRQTIFS